MKKENRTPNNVHYPNPNSFSKYHKNQIMQNFSHTPDAQTLRNNFKPRFIVKQNKGKNNRCQSLHLQQDFSSKFNNHCHSKYQDIYQNSQFHADNTKPQQNSNIIHIKPKEESKFKEFQNQQTYQQRAQGCFLIKNVSKNYKNISTDRSSFIADFKDNTQRFTINADIGGFSQNASRVNEYMPIRNVSSATYDVNAHVTNQRKMKKIGQLQELQSDSDKENNGYQFVSNATKNKKKNQKGCVKRKQDTSRNISLRQRSVHNRQILIENEQKQQYWKRKHKQLQKKIVYRENQFEKIVHLSGKIIQQLQFLQEKICQQNQKGRLSEGRKIGEYISSRLEELMEVYTIFDNQKIN